MSALFFGPLFLFFLVSTTESAQQHSIQPYVHLHVFFFFHSPCCIVLSVHAFIYLCVCLDGELSGYSSLRRCPYGGMVDYYSESQASAKIY